MENRSNGPDGQELPVQYRTRIQDLEQEYKDGEITRRGYEMRFERIMDEYKSNKDIAPSSPGAPSSPDQHVPTAMDYYNHTQNTYSSYTVPNINPRRENVQSIDYNARKSTVMGFKKPGINLDALLGEFSDDENENSINTNGQQQMNGGNNGKRLSRSTSGTSRSSGGRFSTLSAARSPAMYSAHGAPPVPMVSKEHSASGVTAYSVGKRVVDDISENDYDSDDLNGVEWERKWATVGHAGVQSGRAVNVLNDIMHPYGVVGSGYSDSSSANESLYDLDDFNNMSFHPEIIAEGVKPLQALDEHDGLDSNGYGSSSHQDAALDSLELQQLPGVGRMNSILYPHKGSNQSNSENLRKIAMNRGGNARPSQSPRPTPSLGTNSNSSSRVSISEFELPEPIPHSIPSSISARGTPALRQPPSQQDPASQSTLESSPQAISVSSRSGGLESPASIGKKDDIEQNADIEKPSYSPSPPYHHHIIPHNEQQEPEVVEDQYYPIDYQQEQVPSRQALEQVPSRQPLQQISSRQALEQVPSQQSLQQVSSRQALGQVPSQQSLQQVSSRQPLMQVPSQQPLQKAPSRQLLQRIAPQESLQQQQQQQDIKDQASVRSSSVSDYAITNTASDLGSITLEDMVAASTQVPFSKPAPNTVVTNTADRKPLAGLHCINDADTQSFQSAPVMEEVDTTINYMSGMDHEATKAASINMQYTNREAVDSGAPLPDAAVQREQSPVAAPRPDTGNMSFEYSHEEALNFDNGESVVALEPEAINMTMPDSREPITGSSAPYMIRNTADVNAIDNEYLTHSNLDPQPQETSKAAVRGPTFNARMGRQPNTAGGADRVLYYAPEAELEVPANFDMGDIAVPPSDDKTALAYAEESVEYGEFSAPPPTMVHSPAGWEQEQYTEQVDEGVPQTLSSIGAIIYPREVPAEAYPKQLRQLMANHKSLPSVLRYRAKTTPNAIAYTCIDSKGKEIGSWTWNGLHMRAMQIVQVLRRQGVAVWGDRVALVYRKYEMLEFVGSLFGCFYAGACAVPIVAGDSYAELIHVLNSTSAVVVLTTDLNKKSLNKDMTQNNVGPEWPTDVPWVRTDNLGGHVLSAAGVHAPSSQFHSRQIGEPGFSNATETRIDDIGPHDIAYIEFSKSPNGELKGVQVTHEAVLRQCVGWMMSTDMLVAGRRHTHRVELEQAQLAVGVDYFNGVVDPNNELGEDTPPATPQSAAAAVPSTDNNPMGGQGERDSSSSYHAAIGTHGKKWGASTGFLGRLRNVGHTLPRVRRNSRTRSGKDLVHSVASKISIGSQKSLNQMDSSGSRSRAGSAASAQQQQQQHQQQQQQRLAVQNPPLSRSESSDVVISYIEPRQHFGLVFGILGGCYGGHQSVYVSSALCDNPGAYINLLTRYRATVAVGDYTGLQSVLSTATDEPQQITEFSKKMAPNLATLRLVLVDTLFIDPVFHTTFNRNVLHPFGCPYQNISDTEGHPVLTPVSTLAEHGSVLLAMRDCAAKYLPPGVEARAAHEFVLDRDAFKENRISVLPDERNEAEVDMIGTVRYQSFGFPALDSTIAVVDPETRELCAADSIGELWINSPCLGTGFWGLPKLTQSIFAARFTYSVNAGEELVSAQQFLRTGLMGALVQGQVLVFGFYEDRIRTLTIDAEAAQQGWMGDPRLGFHYAGDLNNTIRRYLPQITESTAFEIFANETHFPAIAAEVRHNSGMYATTAEEIYGVLRNRHGLYAYAVALCAPNTLPRAFQYGKRTVNAQLCRHQFESGRVNCLYVKLSTDNLFMNLPPPARLLPPDDLDSVQDASVAMYGRWIQQTSLEDTTPSIDERSGLDLRKMRTISDVLIWRAAKNPEDIAYSQFDERARALKPVSFQKLLLKVSALAQLMLERKRVSSGDHVLVVMTPSPNFVISIHACLAIGAIPIPVSPPDTGRLSEDLPPLLATIREFRVAYMLVDMQSDEIFKSKEMEGALRAPTLVALLGGQAMAHALSINRASKSPKHILGRGSFKPSSQWAEATRPALVMQFTGAQASKPQYVTYTHTALLGFCAQQKGDFQMLATTPIIASVRAYNGYGLLHCAMLGVYVGCTTLLLAPADFFAAPSVWFDLVQRFKVKDAFATLPMLQHSMNVLAHGKLRFGLHGVRNLILATDERVDPDTYARIRDFFALAHLDSMAINPLYGTAMNPCISTRAYLGVSPLTLRLDIHALRRRRVVALPPDADAPHSLVLQDSGKVSGSTMVAIVDPATRAVLPAGSIGEVWVCSRSNAITKHCAGARRDSSTGFIHGNSDNEFVRTGDLGFLYLQVPSGLEPAPPAEPYLFVAGKVSETFAVDDYMYFYSDIERCVEAASSNIVVPNNCVVLQTTLNRSQSAPDDELRLIAVVPLLRVPSDSFLPNVACLVFNSVLDSHQVLLDEILFVPRESIPRSRISERRRRTVRGLYESGKLNAFVSVPVSNSQILADGIANPNYRHSLVGLPTIENPADYRV